MKLSVRTAAAVVALTVGASSVAFGQRRAFGDAENPADWVMPNGNYSQHALQRRSPRSTTSNVGDLQVGLDLLDRRAARARGRAAGDRRRDVHRHAVPEHRLRPRPERRRPGDLEVRAEAGSERHRRSCAATRSTAAPPTATARSSSHQADTTVVALDAATGQVVWQVKNGDPAKGEAATSAPLVYKDKVYRRHLRRRVRRAGLA